MIDRLADRHPVSRLCAIYGVSRSGYYAWRDRAPSARSQQDRILEHQIAASFAASKGTYGTPRLQVALRAEGVFTSRRRIGRIMRESKLQARASRLYRANPKLHQVFKGENLIHGITPTGPGQIWVGDVTYIRVNGTWRYLATVVDTYSRRVVGWSLSRHRGTALTLAALRNALRHPRASNADARLIFHSDHGTEYSGKLFRRFVARHGIAQSMTRRALGDNAHAESFFHSLKSDFVHGATFRTDTALRCAVAAYMRFYNHARLHSGLNYMSPVMFEGLNAA